MDHEKSDSHLDKNNLHKQWTHPDDDLERVIKELLRNSMRLDASDITVKSNHCDVTLSGTVKSQDERDYALSVVKLVSGVGKVESNLVVKTHEGLLPSDFGRH